MNLLMRYLRDVWTMWVSYLDLAFDPEERRNGGLYSYAVVTGFLVVTAFFWYTLADLVRWLITGTHE